MAVGTALPDSYYEFTNIRYVTNLNGSGAGSLRDAVEGIADTAGYKIVFLVAGVINLIGTGEITTSRNNINIAGETAPGKGITVIGSTIRIKSRNVRMAGIRICPGDNPTNGGLGNRDCVGIEGNAQPQDVLVEYCTFAYSLDGLLDLWGGGTAGTHPSRVTIRKCFFIEPLANSVHPEGGHSTGLLIGSLTADLLVYKCVFANFSYRAPAIGYGVNVALVNCLTYNWSGHTWQMYGSGGSETAPSFISFYGCVTRLGPSTPNRALPGFDFTNGTPGPGWSIYYDDCQTVVHPTLAAANPTWSSYNAYPTSGGGLEDAGYNMIAASPNVTLPSGLSITPSSSLETTIFDDIGPRRWSSLENRITAEVQDGTLGSIKDQIPDVQRQEFEFPAKPTRKMFSGTSAGASTDSTGSYSVKASATVVPDGVDRAYFVMYTAEVQHSVTTDMVDARLVLASGSGHSELVCNTTTVMPKDGTNWYPAHGVYIQEVAAGDSAGDPYVFQVQFRRNGSSGTSSIRNVKVFALELGPYDIYQTDQGSSYSTGSTSYTSLASCPFDVPMSGRYWIGVAGALSASNTSSQIGARLTTTALNVDGTYGILASSVSERFPIFSSHSVYYSEEVPDSGVPNNIPMAVQCRVNAATVTVTLHSPVFWAIKLDYGGDWAYTRLNTSVDQNTTGTAYTDLLSLSKSFYKGDYLAVATVNTRPGSTSHDTFFGFEVDSVPQYEVQVEAKTTSNPFSRVKSVGVWLGDGVLPSNKVLRLEHKSETSGQNAYNSEPRLMVLGYNVELPYVTVIADNSLSSSSDSATLARNFVADVQDSYHAGTSDNTTIIPNFVLTSQDSYKSINSDLAPIGDVVLTVAPEDAMHIDSSDNVDLVQTHGLIAHESVIAVESGALSFTQISFLSLASSYSALTTDLVVVSQVHGLITEGAIHSSASTAAALELLTLIGVAGSEIVIDSDEVYLQQQQYLGAATSVHGHAADAPVLTLGALRVRDAAGVVVSDAVVLFDTLVASDARSSHTASNTVLFDHVTVYLNDSRHGVTSDHPTFLTISEIGEDDLYVVIGGEVYWIAGPEEIYDVVQ